MTYETSPIAIGVFVGFVVFVLTLSFWLGRKATSAKGYYAAHGTIPWFVNGVAFAGDYLSAASFLGICGMIAFYGFDGFLYSIGFLAGWVVALFVIAEPIKRLGKFTFADALDSRFNSRGIKLSAAISTLVVSIFYLIPQMVGAGALITPLLGFSHVVGVLMVGTVVTLIVVTAGMVSTTWVQFIKGSMLVVFCLMLTVMILGRGFLRSPAPTAGATPAAASTMESTGPLGPVAYIRELNQSTIAVNSTTVNPAGTSNEDRYEKKLINGSDMLTPGGSPTFKGIRSENLADKLDFISLMMALFAGTASLPHILIRYYTVKDAAAARKSTVVGIISIGFFYVLTLYIGLGALTSGALDPSNSNMAAPLLAKTFGKLPFAIISAIAFTTVLGTVSGLIIAASGAVAHDLMTNFLKMDLSDHGKVRAGKIASVVVGVIAMILGIVFQKMNVGFLVGWAFNVAASANLPALIMLLFWGRTTKQGISAGIVVGLASSLLWLLLSGPAYKDVYGWNPADAPMPFSQPGLVTIPLGFITLIAVSLITQPKAAPTTR
ncbi:MAG TPA: cation acetate symporter [Tepidisphaeraceae bacterium]|jgi:cation/acetate symporter|nr:cation acetate symporter [Tepidisphaeraceae bacterium]